MKNGRPMIGIIYKRYQEALESPLIPGQNAFALSKKWFDQFYKAYESRTHSFNSKIDNSSIALQGKLRRHIVLNENYFILPASAWNILFSIYGGGPTLPIQVLPDPLTGEGVPVPIPSRFTIYFGGQSSLFEVPNLITIGDLKSAVCKYCNLQPERCRIRDFNHCIVHRILDDNILIRDLNFPNDTRELLLEYQDENNVWSKPPVILPKKTPQPGKTFSPTISLPKKYDKGEPGLCGLQNIGNTCYFNSILQCLVHAKQLTNFLIDSKDLYINIDNKAGTSGFLIREYIHLLNDLYTANSCVIAPRQLKNILGQFAPQFRGFAQQDAHEFLTIFLDLLNEDLNLTKESQTFVAPEGNGSNDFQIAKETLERLKNKSYSPIMDKFMTLIKSTIICPNCSSKFITFSHNLSLSVPIHLKATKTLSVTYIPYDRMNPPILFSIPFEVTTSRDEIDRFIVAKIGKIDITLLYVFKQVGFDYKIIFDPSPSSSGQTFAFEVPSPNGFYSILSVFTTQRKKNGEVYTGEVSAPLLLEIFNDINIHSDDINNLVNNSNDYQQIRELVIERCSVFWKSSNADEPPHTESVKASLLVDPSTQSQPQIVLNAQLPLTRNYMCANLLSSSIQVILNPSYMITPNFNWATLLNVEDEDNQHIENANINHSKSDDSISLNECFDLFTKPEIVDENNKWNCPHCNEAVKIEKSSSLWSIPPILAVHLCRFLNVGAVRRKYDVNVDFPDFLDMTPYVESYQTGSSQKKPLLYKLYAVSEHFGSLFGGHYTAHCFVDEKDEWYYFNDSSVSKASEIEVHNSNAYILFYQFIENNEVD
ncbi:hypothetical protein TRFO_37711 [Tritrichomonas foetus]|uniref:Ubiquitin carboxyl-terminal hydrolase n=1 Tax=Tritrichomonas foetus TaxID=1144522 RepID=A0A1J4JBU3_9EUKA|nr:hypothetical protein TRFO_37711 [Tritrichomonas foetus]|eukprot:OHS96129.1 hypothetical protein TRFO_37711 [Tritrichomonas foetus]